MNESQEKLTNSVGAADIATKAAENGDYDQAETWAQKSDDPTRTYRVCDHRAAGKGDYAQAQRFGDLADKA